MKNPIIIKVAIDALLDKAWSCWTNPIDIQNWNFASPDWHCPHAENDLSVGGKFKSTMAAKDGSFSFDFSGTYTSIDPKSQISYTLDDNRKVAISFEQQGGTILVTQSFEAESMNDRELQRQGWTAILENFKRYVESHNG